MYLYLMVSIFVRYVRILAALYVRMTAHSKEIYEELEPLLSDYRKIRQRTKGNIMNIFFYSFYLGVVIWPYILLVTSLLIINFIVL